MGKFHLIGLGVMIGLISGGVLLAGCGTLVNLSPMLSPNNGGMMSGGMGGMMGGQGGRGVVRVCPPPRPMTIARSSRRSRSSPRICAISRHASR